MALKNENVFSIDVTPRIFMGNNCLQPIYMNLYHLLNQIRQFIKVLKYSIIDGADKIENVCSSDVTPEISREITACSSPV